MPDRGFERLPLRAGEVKRFRIGATPESVTPAGNADGSDVVRESIQGRASRRCVVLLRQVCVTAFRPPR